MLTPMCRTVSTLPIYPMVGHLSVRNVEDVMPRCTLFGHQPGVRMDDLSAHITLPDRYIPRVNLRLSDRSLVLTCTPE